MTAPDDKPGIVLLNLGGPDSLEAVEPFLRNLFSDPAIFPLPRLMRWWLARRISRARAPEAKEIYRQIGGASPLLPRMRAQAAEIERQLKRRGHDWPVAIGMRYWRPFATDAVTELAVRGATRVVGLTMYPHFSSTTTGSSHADLARAVAANGRFAAQATIPAVCAWPTLDAFITHWVEGVIDILDRQLAGDPEAVILCSAHSLPRSIVQRGDPYAAHIEQTVDELRARLKRRNPVRLAYQSRVGKIPWLEPTTDTVLRELGAAGTKKVIVVPVSFTADNSETDYEIHIIYRELAHAVGIEDFIAVPCPNAEPPMMGALADLVVDAIESADLPGARACRRDSRLACPVSRCALVHPDA